eukprot:TRINITY_DN95457_c0_g1_i1.p1 TRINITY_DN95457_c0_g1~~TRINITY_DN95457_c0_g1_i1.p1  ORF type:complete len:154 (-),score=33.95 TRINITY_DN95457_c0_g1_i1:20-481(-)
MDPLLNKLLEPALVLGEVQITGLQILVVLFLVGLFAYQSCQAGGKSCTARHILMKSEAELLKAKARIEAGEDFGKVAAECSTCPSGKSGGSLGSFGPGSMVPAFDRVCFDPSTKIGEIVGPVQTHFGYHLIIVDERKGVEAPESETPEQAKKK